MTHEVGHRNCCTKHFDRRQGKVEGQPSMAAPVSLSVGVCVGSAGWLAGWLVCRSPKDASDTQKRSANSMA